MQFMLEKVGHGGAAAYDGHLTTVEIAEWFDRLSLSHADKVSGQLFPLLDGRLRELRMTGGISRIIKLNTQITNGINVCIAFHLTYHIRQNPSSPANGAWGNAIYAIRRNTGRPDQGMRLNRT